MQIGQLELSSGDFSSVNFKILDLIRVSNNFSKRTRTLTRPYSEIFISCNKWICNVIEISFQGRDNTNIRKR